MADTRRPRHGAQRELGQPPCLDQLQRRIEERATQIPVVIPLTFA
jgi:hypothetical protein